MRVTQVHPSPNLGTQQGTHCGIHWGSYSRGPQDPECVGGRALEQGDQLVLESPLLLAWAESVM